MKGCLSILPDIPKRDSAARQGLYLRHWMSAAGNDCLDPRLGVKPACEITELVRAFQGEIGCTGELRTRNVKLHTPPCRDLVVRSNLRCRVANNITSWAPQRGGRD